MKNLFHGIPAHVAEELTETLVKTDNVRIERIVSHGHASPEDFWYDQEESEWVVVLQGAAKLQFDDKIIELATGASINIPARQRHRARSTSFSLQNHLR